MQELVLKKRTFIKFTGNMCVLKDVEKDEKRANGKRRNTQIHQFLVKTREVLVFSPISSLYCCSAVGAPQLYSVKCCPCVTFVNASLRKSYIGAAVVADTNLSRVCARTHIYRASQQCGKSRRSNSGE